MTYHIHNDNVLTWAQAYEGPLFHAICTDPPYELNFMNRGWDNSGIAFRPEFWAAMKTLLYPGAFGFAFASTRGYHRMACAIEDAGFIIHPMIAYAFGSGFPKATRIDTQIDAAAGVEVAHRNGFNFKGRSDPKFHDWEEKNRNREPVHEATTELAQAWQGHRYGLQAMKPALEPICVFQKPYDGRPVDCMVRTGAGALNIDGARIGESSTPRKDPRNGNLTNAHMEMRPWMKQRIENGEPLKGDFDGNQGRWPSNLILGHSAACTEHGCAADCAVERMGRQSGVVKSGGAVYETPYKDSPTRFTQGTTGRVSDNRFAGDEGTAARYFQHTDWALEAHDPFYYTAKASTAEREAGLEHLPLVEASALTGRKPGSAGLDGNRELGYNHNPLAKTTTARRNTHPTLKPLSLTRYLASLLLPPDAYAPRRLLVPFSGSGSEAIGAMLAGWDEIHGIELSAEYCEIAEARLAFWSQRKHLAHVKLQQVKPHTTQQASLFDTLQF